MAKYILFTNNIMAARYDTDITPNVPTDAIEVSEELFAETITNVDGVWTLVKGEIINIPTPPYIPTAEENKQTAVSLLQQTDWVNQPDVRNTAVSPHLLNGAEFDTYRVAVRQYAVYPVEGNIDWPVMPEEQWSN